MKQLTVIGANTLLGLHLTKTLDQRSPEVGIKLWDYTDGLHTLEGALKGSDTVINLHEVQDFSLIPDTDKLQKHNVAFVAELLSKCEASATCKTFVHLSTVYLQCSVKWPNVYGAESEEFQHKYLPECPYPEYCQSKHQAEEMVRNAGILGRVIARLGPIYGEGDRHSLVCDYILGTHAFGRVLRVGDTPENMGVLQFTYAGNAAHALLHCANQMQKMDGKPESELVIINDHTPLENFYSLMLEQMMQEQNDEEEEEKKVKVEKETKVQNSKEKEEDQGMTMKMTIKLVVGESEEEMKKEMEAEVKKLEEEEKKMEPGKKENHNKREEQPPSILLTNRRVPFMLFYVPYMLLCSLVCLIHQLFGVNSVLNKAPKPSYIYLLLRQWTFYSSLKLRLFFQFKPPFDWQQSLERSRDWYQQLKPDQIRGPSWLPTLEED